MYYSKEHTIFFGEKNTWTDWHLVPSARPEVKPAPFLSNYIEIPGRNGTIDASTSLTGYPTFGNREGSWEFLVMNDYDTWSNVYSNIMNTIHGRQMKIRLADDPDYYYLGRLNVSDFASDKTNSIITIDYNFEPYKYHAFTVAEEYPEYFSVVDIPGDGKKYILFDDMIQRGFVDNMPILPTIKTTLDNENTVIWIRFVNQELGIDIRQGFRQGTRQSPRFVISNFNGENTCYFEVDCDCAATFELNYRNGRL